MTSLGLAGSLLVVTPALTVSAQEPSLPELLRKAADYVADYRGKVSGVSLEEQLMLTDVGPRQSVPRRVASDLILLNISERLTGMRDPFALDTRKLREREPRIVRVLAEPSLASWQRAQDLAREGAYLMMSNVVLWYNDPVLALQFIEAQHQPKMTYKLEGRKRMNNVQVYGIGFKENQAEKMKYMIGTPSNPYSSGRFWVDPATGAIHQTELWIQSDSDTIRSLVSYAPDAKLGVLLPREATHSFQDYERGNNISNLGQIDSGSAGRRLTFEGSARYGNPQYTPIDLSRISR